MIILSLELPMVHSCGCESSRTKDLITNYFPPQPDTNSIRKRDKVQGTCTFEKGQKGRSQKSCLQGLGNPTELMLWMLPPFWTLSFTFLFANQPMSPWAQLMSCQTEPTGATHKCSDPDSMSLFPVNRMLPSISPVLANTALTLLLAPDSSEPTPSPIS